MTLDDVRNLLRKRSASYKAHCGTGVRGWCTAHKVQASHATEFLKGKRGPGSDLLDALGLEWRITRKSKSKGEQNGRKL